MKKYSWIFALILALTMAFVFAACGSDDDGDDGKKDDNQGNQGNQGGQDEWNLAALNALPGGITLYPYGSNPPYDADNKVIHVTITESAGTGFYIKFEDVTGLTVAAGDKVIVTYACVVVTPVAAVTLKNGANSWSDFSPAIYTEFEEGKSKTLEFTAAATTGVSFQHNWYANDDVAKASEYYVKITGVDVKSPKVLLGDFTVENSATQKGWCTNGMDSKETSLSIEDLLAAKYLVLELSAAPTGGMQIIWQGDGKSSSDWNQTNSVLGNNGEDSDMATVVGTTLTIELSKAFKDYDTVFQLCTQAKFFVGYYSTNVADLGITSAYLLIE
jgi:hypothetical protein